MNRITTRMAAITAALGLLAIGIGGGGDVHTGNLTVG